MDPLKCDLSDGGTTRFKWVRHHVTPRRALFAPRIGNGGPNPTFVVDSRTTHVEGSTSIEDYWKDPMLSNRVLDSKWTGKSIFIEEIPNDSVSSLDLDFR